VELSLQPWRAFRPDGVIMFSDILTPLPAMGIEFDVVKGKGPIIEAPVKRSPPSPLWLILEILFQKGKGFTTKALITYASPNPPQSFQKFEEEQGTHHTCPSLKIGLQNSPLLIPLCLGQKISRHI